ncbi:MAG: MoaD/ThiS family protein [Thermodesulfobacteriota bacterium]
MKRIARVHLRVSSMIRLKGRKSQHGWVELPQRMQVGALLHHLGLNLGNTPALVVIDGKVSSMDAECSGGEHIVVLPVIGGG